MNLIADDKLFCDSYKINFQNISVSYQEVDSFIKNIDTDYNLIIHMGVAYKATKLKIELNAINIANGTDMLLFHKNDEPIQVGDYILSTTIDENKLNNLLVNFSEEVEISLDAGKYLCNYIYYQSLFHFAPIPIIFIHIADFEHLKNATTKESQSRIIKAFIHSFFNKNEEII